jgi:predicted permease
MAGVPRFRRGFRLPWRTARTLETDVDEELRFHLEMRAEELAALRGLDAAAARAEALRQFGDLEDARRYMRAMDHDTETLKRRRDRMADMQRNFRYALRALLRTPFISAVAVLSLALGIGANAAIFSLFDQMILRPLPVPHPERLVNLGAPGPKYGSTSCGQAGYCDQIFSYPTYRGLERAGPGISLAAHRDFGANLAFRHATANGEGALVSGSYFTVLGLRPAVGRLLGPADDQKIGGDFVAVLSYDYWRNHLGADPGVVGQLLVINGQSMTIVGVAPKGFEGTVLGARPWVFVPLTMRGLMSPGVQGFDEPRNYWIYVFGRLKPGVDLEHARTLINAVYHPIIENTEGPLQQGNTEKAMQEFRAMQVTVEPGARGQSRVHGEVRTPLTLLLTITGIVLLIACANIANLLLARGAARRMEMTVRLALGASRRQVLAQLLTESILLAVIGGAVSLLVAYWTLGLIGSTLPAADAGALPLHLQPPVLLFTAGLSLLTGLLFGMFPALHSTRLDLISSIRAGAGQITGARAAARFRTGLVVAQIALSMALLIFAGLFLRSLMNISRVDLGVRTDNVVTFDVSPQLNGYQPERSRILFERLAEELASIPGVTAASAGRAALFAGSNWGNNVSVQGFKSGPDIDSHSRFNMVGPGYFHTLGVPVLSGREFTDADRVGAPKVAVVNEAFAKKFHLGRDVVGKWIGTSGGDSLDTQIVGLVKDAKYSEVKDEVPPLYFQPYRQKRVGSLTFYVRTAGDLNTVMRAIPGVVSKLDPNLPVEGLKTLPQQVKENVSLDRLISTLSGAFAVLATLLATIGLYGVLAYTVAQRSREIGVRMALGADARRVRRLVLSQVGRMILVGGVIGLAAALLLGRYARSLLFDLQGYDAVTLIVAPLLLAAVALGAGYLPARRASRVDPVETLRAQ